MDINAATTSERFDVLIVGGGPAGLSAALYLARACRTVAVFDCRRPGRSDWAQTNHNFLGFPDGVTAVELTNRGRVQAEGFGARVLDAEVVRLWQDDAGFVAQTRDRVFHGRAVILAPGVRDRWVEFPGWEEFVGKTMHWCIVCDGYEMRGKRVVVVGNDDDAAEEAIQMLAFAETVTLITNSGALGLTRETVARLDAQGIRLVVGRIAGARAKEPGVFGSLLLDGDEEIPLDHLFSVQGAEPLNALARSLGAAIDAKGYVDTDGDGRTSVPGLFAAGDVTRRNFHQISAAVHEGAAAACAVNYELFRKDQAAFAVSRGAPAE